MATVQTIVPIFAIIFLGALARHWGIISDPFLAPANRLVYYFAIPAMIFHAISGSSLSSEMNPTVLLVSLVSLPLAFLLAYLLSGPMELGPGRSRTFIQSSFHGNLGYIGLAVIFYYLGTAGLVKGSITAGFIMIVQNILGVLALQLFAGDGQVGGRLKHLAGRVIANPVIVSALAGILFSALNLTMPVILDRSLKILGGLALPMALLLIGASLSFSLARTQFFSALLASVIKLFILPLLALIMFRYMGVSLTDYLPALILLASPTATLTYVFANEMHGDADLAVATISLGTILSAFSFSVWLHWAGG